MLPARLVHVLRPRMLVATKHPTPTRCHSRLWSVRSGASRRSWCVRALSSDGGRLVRSAAPGPVLSTLFDRIHLVLKIARSLSHSLCACVRVCLRFACARDQTRRQTRRHARRTMASRLRPPRHSSSAKHQRQGTTNAWPERLPNEVPRRSRSRCTDDGLTPPRSGRDLDLWPRHPAL